MISFLGSKSSMITAKLQSIPKGALSLNARVLYQMCHSMKCRTQNEPFRSTAVQIPGAVVDNIPEFSEDDGVDQLLAAMPLPEWCFSRFKD